MSKDKSSVNKNLALYDEFLAKTGVDRLQKILARYELLKMVGTVPGDIVECGVFKGSGIYTFGKISRLLTPHTGRKIVGFDFFDAARAMSRKPPKRTLKKIWDFESRSSILMLTITKERSLFSKIYIRSSPPAVSWSLTNTACAGTANLMPCMNTSRGKAYIFAPLRLQIRPQPISSRSQFNRSNTRRCLVVPSSSTSPRWR